MRKINLGCGKDILPGWENYDMFPFNEQVNYIDLQKLPLPFESNSVDEIKLSQVLEHLDVIPYDFLVDCHRILKPGGRIMIGLPSFSFGVTHLRGLHSKYYLDVFIREQYRGSDSYHDRVSFSLESFKHDWSLKHFIQRLYELVFNLGSEKLEWRLRK